MQVARVYSQLRQGYELVALTTAKISNILANSCVINTTICQYYYLHTSKF
jgi:hypothetical protein